LIDPSTLIDLFAELDLGPNGSIAFLTSDGKVLASRGSPPSLTAKTPSDSIRMDRRSERFSIVVVGTSSRLWAVRDWRNDLAIILPVGLLCSGGLGFLVLRLARNRGGLLEEIRLALKHNEFEAHYQPTIDTATSRCVGAEVLIRWNHPERGYIRPDLFIAVAEESGLIEPITESLMRTVAAEMAEMMRKHPDLHLGINLAPEQFNSRRILEEFPRIFTEGTIAPDRILLEATERSLIEDDQGLPHQIMAELRKLGARIALDDFGTGYSSLSYIQKFRFDYIKIDASFVKRIGRDTVSSGLINAIIDLGRTLKVSLIAEGVENELQFQFLKQHGVQYVQGWLFGKAMPARQFRDFVARQNA
jgi:sensor c-di-GMP phosphodiesterase-like protein